MRDDINCLLAVIELHFPAPKQHKYFNNHDPSYNLNGLFTMEVIHCIPSQNYIFLHTLVSGYFLHSFTGIMALRKRPTHYRAYDILLCMNFYHHATKWKMVDSTISFE